MSKVTIGQVFLMDENDAKELEYRVMKQSVAAYEKEHGVSVESEEGKARLDKYEEANKPLDKVKQMALDVLRVPQDIITKVADMMIPAMNKIEEEEGALAAEKFSEDVAREVGRIRNMYILVVDKKEENK